MEFIPLFIVFFVNLHSVQWVFLFFSSRKFGKTVFLFLIVANTLNIFLIKHAVKLISLSIFIPLNVDMSEFYFVLQTQQIS